MKAKPKLILAARTSWLPTRFPVYYYGLPDGRVFVLWIRLNKSDGNYFMEYVMEECIDFSFDYSNKQLIDKADKNRFVLDTNRLDLIDRKRMLIASDRIELYKFSKARSWKLLTSLLENPAPQQAEG